MLCTIAVNVIDAEKLDFALAAAGALQRAAAVVPQDTQPHRLVVFRHADFHADPASPLTAVFPPAPAINMEVRQRQFASAPVASLQMIVLGLNGHDNTSSLHVA
jgi:hypothetical protein